MKKILKRSLAVFLVVIMVIGTAPLAGFVGLEFPEFKNPFVTKVQAASSGSCGKNISYNFNEATGVLSIYGSGEMYGYTNPGGSNPAPWSSFADKIISVNIGEGIKRISGFSELINLEKVSMPNTVTQIDEWCFRFSNKLSTINFSTSLKEIGSCAFSFCESLENVSLPSSVTKIGSEAFAHTGISNISIPSGVDIIERTTFSGCSNLSSVSLSEGLKEISELAFYKCEKLSNIELPDSIAWLDEDVFEKTPYLENTSNYSNGVLYNNKCLLKVQPSLDGVVDIKAGIKVIAGEAFENCTKLIGINIPNSVKSIGSCAFINCSSIISLSFPESIESFGYGFAKGCKNLNSFYYRCKYDNRKYDGSRSGGPYFQECTELFSVNLGENVETIPSGLLEGCYNITEIIIPKSVKKIESSAFEGTGINYIFIPEFVEEIDETAFRNCNSLEMIEVDSNNKNYFNDNSGVLYDDYSIIKYPPANPQKTYHSSINKLVTGEMYDFYNYFDVEYAAFENCFNLEEINLNISSTISNKAFNGCVNLKSIGLNEYSLLDRVYIGVDAFSSCKSIADVYYNDTEERWKAIVNISTGNEYFTNATMHYNHVFESGEELPSLDILALTSTFPANNATSISYDDELVLTFNQNLYEDLYILDPNSAIKICDYNTDAVIYSIGYNDYGITGFVDSPVVIDGNILTIRNALHKLVPGSKYYVTISPNIILSQPDSDGNRKSFAGITDKETWNFSYLSPSVKERYSLDVYFNEPTVSLSAGESANISAVLSFNGATTSPEMSFSIDDTNVAEITEIKTESNIAYAKIRGNNQGSATITVTANTIDGNIVKKFPVFVSDPETIYYCNYIDGRFDEYNPFYVSGMYIDNFKHIEYSDGSVSADFDVYNGNHSIGVVEVYDENGTIKDVEIIDMFDSDYPSDIFSHAGYAYKLVEGMATGELFDSDMYTSGIWHQKTHISITIPQNGYYLITNNISVSDYCLIYNMTLLAVESAFKVTDSIMDATAVSKDISKTISNAMPTIGDIAFKALKKLAKSIIKGWSENLAETSVGIEKVFDDFYDFITTCGFDFAKLLVDSVKKVAPEAATALVLEKLYDVTLDKCGAKIVDNIFYKPVEVAKWGAVFASISENSSSRSVYIYNQQNNSMRKSNGIVSYTTENYNTVFHTVILKSGDKVDYVNRLTGEQEKAKVYDISLIRDGESVQPKDSVTVYIPIPNGWNIDNLTLYHVSKETGKREKIPVEIENGYAKFVTDSFSYFILSTDELKFVDNFGIKTPSTATISYGDTLILHADVESVPNGTSIVWETSNDGVSIKSSDDGLSCAVTSAKTNTVSVSAKLVDDNGDIVTNFDGEELTASQIIKSNAGFFQKIIAFFKKLFGLTKTIPQVYKGIF